MPNTLKLCGSKRDKRLKEENQNRLRSHIPEVKFGFGKKYVAKFYR